jgi:methyl-accepting chemotaxis protein
MTFQGRQQEVGMGQSGESYLIGSDFRARTNSRFMDGLSPKQKRVTLSSDTSTTAYTSIGLLEVNTLGAKQAILGNRGESLYENYLGTEVLGAYSKLRIPGLDWGMVVEQDIREAFAPAQQLFTKVLLLGLLMVGVVGILGLWFAHRLSRPILELDATMRKVSAGMENARASVRSNDELEDLAQTFNEMLDEHHAIRSKIEKEHHLLQLNIQELLLVVSSASEGTLDVRARVSEGVLGNVADALNEMMNRFSELIANAKRASDHVATSASEISSASQDLSKASSTQSAQVARTSSNVQQFSAEALAIVQTLRTAITAAERTRSGAEQGSQVVREIIEGMEKIHENVETNTKKVKRLGERSMEISGIIHAISDISVQTDMLALNAAMEASRAGEQGKGFVLVAENVRVLSDRAKALTVEIEKLVSLIQNEATEAVAHLEIQTQEVERGARRVTHAGQVFENLVQASIQSSELIAQINHSSTEQSSRTQGILDSVSHIKSISESTQTEVSVVRRSSEQLTRLSNELNEQLTRFRIPSR